MYTPDPEAHLDNIAQLDWSLHIRSIWPGNRGETWERHVLTVYGDDPIEVHMMAASLCATLNDGIAKLDVWEEAAYVTQWEDGSERSATCEYNHLRRQVRNVDRDDWDIDDSLGVLQARFILRENDDDFQDIGLDPNNPKILELRP